jgi:hypothetical protein
MSFLSNPTAIFWIAIVLICTVPTAITFWYKAKRTAIDADLKMKMLEMGMSADEIERVLMAESNPDGRTAKKR